MYKKKQNIKKEEREVQAEMEFELGQKFGEEADIGFGDLVEEKKEPSGNPNPKRPNPDVTSNSISVTKSRIADVE